MRVTEDTKKYARKALAYIEKHPEQHDQGHWIERGEAFAALPGDCGTTMCVAGTVNFLKNGPLEAYSLRHQSEYIARDLLGLSLGEVEVLFYEMDKDRALAKLRKVAAGEQFDRDDYYIVDEDNEDEDPEPIFAEHAWDIRDKYRY